MKISLTLLLALVLLGFAAHVVAEDMFVWKKINNTVPITDSREMMLLYKRAGKTQKKKLSEIQLIQIDGLDDFNKAEKLMNGLPAEDGSKPKPKPKPKPAQAVKLYDAASKSTELKWHQHLIACRRLRALDAASMVARATEEWLMLVSTCSASGESIKASPTRAGDKAGNEKAIALLEVKLDRIENKKLIIAIGELLDIIREKGDADEKAPAKPKKPVRKGRLLVKDGDSHMVFVIDSSDSMIGGPMDAAKKDVLRSIAGLAEIQTFHIIAFHEKISYEFKPKRLVTADKKNKYDAEKFVINVRSRIEQGDTNPLAAVL